MKLRVRTEPKASNFAYTGCTNANFLKGEELELVVNSLMIESISIVSRTHCLFPSYNRFG